MLARGVSRWARRAPGDIPPLGRAPEGPELSLFLIKDSYGKFQSEFPNFVGPPPGRLGLRFRVYRLFLGVCRAMFVHGCDCALLACVARL